MQIEFSGAAREVTGSCHILRVGHSAPMLLDCGLFQGTRAESRAKNARLPLPIDEIDAIVLSHAHIDHAGRLPFLVNQGYKGTIWATAATRDLCAIMLADSAHIQEKDAEFLERHGREHAEPLYTHRGCDAHAGTHDRHAVPQVVRGHRRRARAVHRSRPHSRLARRW